MQCHGGSHLGCAIDDGRRRGKVEVRLVDEKQSKAEKHGGTSGGSGKIVEIRFLIDVPYRWVCDDLSCASPQAGATNGVMRILGKVVLRFAL